MHLTVMQGDVEALYRSEGGRLWSAVRGYAGDGAGGPHERDPTRL